MRTAPAIARTNPETCSSVPEGRPGTDAPSGAIIANNLQTVEPDFLLEVDPVGLVMGDPVSSESNLKATSLELRVTMPAVLAVFNRSAEDQCRYAEIAGHKNKTIT
jgi:hypothetical protein